MTDRTPAQRLLAAAHRIRTGPTPETPALMAPALTVPLAAWLRDVVALHGPDDHDGAPDGCQWCGDEDWPCTDTWRALAVADAILCRAPEPDGAETGQNGGQERPAGDADTATRTRAANAPHADAQRRMFGEHVAGHCPACGRPGLFLGDGGHVTCGNLQCPAPCRADEWLHGEGDTKQCRATIAIAEGTVRCYGEAGHYDHDRHNAAHTGPDPRRHYLRQVWRDNAPDATPHTEPAPDHADSATKASAGQRPTPTQQAAVQAAIERGDLVGVQRLLAELKHAVRATNMLADTWRNAEQAAACAAPGPDQHPAPDGTGDPESPQPSSEEPALRDRIDGGPADPIPGEEDCGNCDGIDPDSCFTHPQPGPQTSTDDPLVSTDRPQMATDELRRRVHAALNASADVSGCPSELTDVVMAVVQPALDYERGLHADTRREVEKSENARAHLRKRLAAAEESREQAEATLDRVRYVIDVIEANDIGWAARSLRHAIEGTQP